VAPWAFRDSPKPRTLAKGVSWAARLSIVSAISDQVICEWETMPKTYNRELFRGKAPALPRNSQDLIRTSLKHTILLQQRFYLAREHWAIELLFTTTYYSCFSETLTCVSRRFLLTEHVSVPDLPVRCLSR